MRRSVLDHGTRYHSRSKGWQGEGDAFIKNQRNSLKDGQGNTRDCVGAKEIEVLDDRISRNRGKVLRKGSMNFGSMKREYVKILARLF